MTGSTCIAGKCVCQPACTSCGGPDGCGGTCSSGSCSAGGTCVSGSCRYPTTSLISPGNIPKFFNGTVSVQAYARPLIYTVDSLLPSTIRFTTDGSTPSSSSTSKASPADLGIIGDASLHWYADTGVREATTHSFDAIVDTGLQSYYGYLVDAVKLNGKGPVAVVSPGATVSGTANIQIWSAPGCPGCRLQLLYGVESSPTACFYDYSPGAYPGHSGTAVAFTVTAPSTAGTYRVDVTYQAELSCADALAKNGLNARPTEIVGWIVVK
jgi:hypothetical protein